METLRLAVARGDIEELRELLRQREISFENAKPPQSGVVYAAVGDFVVIASTAIPWAAVSAVLVSWINARSRRKIMITTRDNEVIHVEGMGLKELDQVIDRSKEITLFEIPDTDE